MKEIKKTLYVGAHPDDVCIGASIAISRAPEKSYVLTVSNGIARGQTWPAKVGRVIIPNSSEYGNVRLGEDKAAMDILGVDVDNNYFNGEIPDLEAHLCFGKIYNLVDELVKAKGIERIVTHSFPEAHPDHEVVSLCSHLVGQENGVSVWEYPMYVIDVQGSKVDREFLDYYGEKTTLGYDSNELSLRKRILFAHASQDFVNRRFGDSRSESFRLFERDLSDLPSSNGYFYGDSQELPTPLDIRQAFDEFVLNN